MKDSEYLNKLVKRTLKNKVIINHKLKKLQRQLDMIKQDLEYESTKLNSKEPQNINTYKNNKIIIGILLIVILITIQMIHYIYKQ